MKRLVVGIIAAAVLVSMAHTAMAQTKTVKAEMRTETAIVESIDAKTRTITLKRPDGTFVGTVAGPEVKRFAEIKVGDKVSAKYYENVVLRLLTPGERGVDTASRTTTSSGRRSGSSSTRRSCRTPRSGSRPASPTGACS